MRTDNNSTYLILAIIIVAAIGAVGISNKLSQASIASITPQDVKFGDKPGDTGKYYVMTAYIGARTDGFEIILPKDKEIDLGNNQFVKNSNEVKVQINPLMPTQTIGVQQGTQIQYTCYNYGITTSMCTPEYYKISGNWLTTTKYRISTYSNGAQLYSQDVDVNYQNAQEVKVGSIAIENIGQLGNGYNTPTQNFVVVKDPTGTYRLFTEAGFQNFVNRVNAEWITYLPLGSVSWQKFWDTGSKLGVIPRDEKPSDATVSYTYLNSKVNQIVLTLPVATTSSTIIIYIPQSVASGIIVIKQASVARITDLSACPTLDEGKSGTVTLSVRNDGSADYMGVSIRSDNHDVNGNTRVFFNAGETKSFTFTLTARGTISDTTVPVTVFADGTAFTNGDESKSLSCRINNVMGFTPTPLPPTQKGGSEGYEATLKGWTENPFVLLLGFLVAGLVITIVRSRK